MKSLALIVRSVDGESTRRALVDQGLLRGDLEVRRQNDEVAFPIRGPPAAVAASARIEEIEFLARRTSRPRRYQDQVSVPPEVEKELPRSFDVVGDIVLVRLPTQLEPYGEGIGTALLNFVPRARIVGWDQGVEGAARIRRIVRLAGEGGWRTRHRENGIELDVDLEHAYFSPRLAGEHARIAREVRAGETVFDLCCGVGPFGMTIARSGRARRLVAIDQNPEAIELLDANQRRLAPAVPIAARCLSLDEFLPTAGVADRVIFNLPHEGIKYLARVLATVGPAGALHYYEVTERADRSGRMGTLLALAPGGAEFEAAGSRVVHPYSPTSDLVSYTLRRH